MSSSGGRDLPSPGDLDLLAALSGLGLGLSLIVAIGSQNAFVLRQGLRRQRVGRSSRVRVSDAVLIAAGCGRGRRRQSRAGLLDVVRIAGAVFLARYGAMAARRALRPAGWPPGTAGAPASLAAPS